MNKVIEEAISLLEEEVVQLRKWASESVDYGYSTHQVKPMGVRAEHLEGRVNAIKARLYDWEHRRFQSPV